MQEPFVIKIKFPHGHLLTNGFLMKLSYANKELRLERSARGELVVLPPVGCSTSARNLDLSCQVWKWAKDRGQGAAFGSSAGFMLPNGAVRAPDASWISDERWSALTKDQREDYAPLCPDFVAELRSWSDSLAEVRAKMQEYNDQGARLGWLIDLVRRVVEVYRPGRPVEVLESPTSLSGEGVLPGFTLDLKRILFDED
jgi:Uma2 family endonuclease